MNLKVKVNLFILLSTIRDNAELLFAQYKARKKNVLVLVIRRVDFEANKKNAGRKINMTP